VRGRGVQRSSGRYSREATGPRWTPRVSEWAVAVPVVGVAAAQIACLWGILALRARVRKFIRERDGSEG